MYLDEIGFDYSNLGFDFEFEDNDWETDITIPEKIKRYARGKI